jgi:hypothetical protein
MNAVSEIVLRVDRSRLPKHTDAEFEAWVKFNVGQLGGITMDNPMWDMDMEAIVERID